MKTITYEQFLEFKPCWLSEPGGRDRLDKIAKAREHWTALDILELPGVAAEEKLWAALREALIGAKTLRLFAVWCARQALALITTPDPRSVSAVDVAERYAHREATDAELAAAWEADWAAARASARAAARAAAQAATWAADWASARAAARAAQVAKLTEMLRMEV